MKNSKQICREVARQLNIPEKEVSEEYMFIMNQLKSTLIGMRGPIMLYKVGSFNINYSKLKKNIQFTIKKVRFYRDSPRCRTRGIKRQLILDNYMDLLHRLLSERDKQATHKMQIKEYYAEKKRKSLAKQTQDAPPGDKPKKAWYHPRLMANKNKS